MSRLKPRCNSSFVTSYLRHRELGLTPELGNTDNFLRGIYSSVLPCTSWDHSSSLHSAAPGGIFNLEFSPDGSLLVAACEKKSILMFDPLSRRLISAIDNAHSDCVNCVRFLDSRVFATCSDDSTVALWDARNLKSKIRTLHGHSNWVKNIEFSQSDGLLVTSGFDGAIYTWDINSYTERGFVYNRVFHTNGLMRTRLNPDASKMIMCTTGGYLMLIHNLDLRTLAQDLDGFKPNMYRLMQLSQTTIPVAATFTHLFSKRRKKNRIEFVTDFPEGDDAEVVSSLQVHPQGWCALSRNISNDENSEWTCVHDIQDLPEDANSGTEEELVSPEQSGGEESDQEEIPPSTSPTTSTSEAEMTSLVIGLAPRRGTAPLNPIAEGNGGGRLPPRRRFLRRQNAFRGFRAPIQVSAPAGIPYQDSIRELTLNTSDVWEALVAIREARARRIRNQEQANIEDPDSRLRIVRMQSGIEGVRPRVLSISPLTSVNLHNRTLRIQEGSEVVRIGDEGEASSSGSRLSSQVYVIRQPSQMRCGFRVRVPKNHRIHENTPRLTHYIEESNMGKGFIKELCFSADGRLICSPFGYGVRLLAFSPNCSELSSCVPKEGPIKLQEVATNISHSDIVVSTKFSPRHCLLVSGCLTGSIVWHQPVL